MKHPSAWGKLRETFDERTINVGSLSPTLRLALGAACAQVVAAVFLLAIRSIPASHAARILVTPTGYNVLTITFDVVLVATIVAWTLFLTGAALAHPVVRASALVAFTYFVNVFTTLTVGPGRTYGVALLLLLWIGFIVSLKRRPQNFSRTAAIVGMVVAGIGIAIYRGAALNVAFAINFTIGLTSISFALIAVLLMAGGELGDWSNLIGLGVASFFDRAGSRTAILVTSVAALALAVLGLSTPWFWRVPLHYYFDLAIFMVAGAAVISVVAWSLRRHGMPHHIHIPWLALLASAVLYAVPTVAAPIVRSYADPVYRAGFSHYHSAEGHIPFSIDPPTLWHEVDICSGRADALVVPSLTGTSSCLGPMQGAGFLALVGNAQFLVETFPQPNAIPNLDTYIAMEARPGRIVSTSARDQRYQYTVKRKNLTQDVVVWEEREDGRTWLLEGSDDSTHFAHTLPSLVRMHDSFHAGETVRGRFNAAQVFASTVMLITCIGAIFVLRRRTSVSAIFLFVFASLYVLENLPQSIGAVTGGDGIGVPIVRLWTVEVGVALFVIASIVMSIRRGRITGFLGALLSAVIGVATIEGFVKLYGFAITAGTTSLVQAVVVLIALAWDLLMSGESITNGDSASFPRAARIGMFCGYITFVSAAILFFASLLDLNGTPVAEFESEGFVQTGIITLGIPVLLTVAIIRIWKSATSAPELPVTGSD